MKISGIETYLIGNPWKRWVFVRVNTDDGLYGVSEATTPLQARTIIEALKESERFYKGRDPMKIEQLWRDWYRDSFYAETSVVTMTALSAIEIACWDIVGKHLGAPISALLGGAMRDNLKAYANGWYTHVRSPEEWGERAKRVVGMGYKAMKFDPFGTAYLTMNEDEVKNAVRIVEVVREAVGDGIELLIEGHGRFSPGIATKIGLLLEPYSPGWFEEPVPPEDLEGLKRVKGSIKIPIAAGERSLSKWGFVTMIQERLIDIAQPDPIVVGGILETKKVSAMAEANMITVAPHQAQGPICSAICAQVAATLPNFMIQESFDEFQVSWANEVVINPVEVQNGYIKVPTRPGLGIDINEDKVAEHPAEGVEDMVLYEEAWWDRHFKSGERRMENT